MVVGAIREGVMKKLNEKDEQIQRIDKLNSLLQQRLKSLFVENQLYRNMALANEAMANSLRTNLEQLLVANVNNKHHSAGTGPRAVAEDTESCCGSNGNYERDRRTAEKEERMCKRCGEKESCVLLLPCRHLCLCAVCGRGSDQLKACQVCNTHTSATLHVNMSS
ncbi:putative BOI-related E3 ubiquitin-protein ligase [Forsythia ovata]|uniref:BOI-related E3 ubiquitin-protein ligase n=1 Tax=Forsythia ovata TaxID=205694 RepID=A0ABD1RA91_9LAMI